MKRLYLLILLFLPSLAFAVETPAMHVSDPDHLLPGGVEAAAVIEAKLRAFEQSSGIRIVLEFHAKSPSTEEDKEPGAYMRAVSTRLGLIKRGAVAVYFADDPDWRLWIGDELVSGFAGKPGTVEELTKSEAMHDAKEAFFTATWAEAEADRARRFPSTPATPAEIAAAQTTALVDGLIRKLDSR